MIRTVSGATVDVSPAYEEALRAGGATPALICKACGRPGRKARRVTLATHVSERYWDLLGDRDFLFLFCGTPHCPVVYFDNAEGRYFGKQDVRTRVGVKETAPPVPVCYCENVLEDRILHEIVVKGCCDSLEDIKEYTKARTGKLCHVTNPAGCCCGAHVAAVIEKALKAVADDALKAKARALGREIPED